VLKRSALAGQARFTPCASGFPDVVSCVTGSSMATVHHHAPEHPGVLLRESVLPDLLSSVSLAARDRAVTRQTLHRILAGSAAISPDMAARLEKLCGIPSEFWLERQHRLELERVKPAIAPILGRIPYHRLSDAIMNKVGEPGEQ